MSRAPLTGRRWDIAAGRTDLPTATAHAYRAYWQSQGYALPVWLGRTRGLGDVIAYITHRVPLLQRRRCAACDSRRRVLNRWFRFPWPLRQ